MENSSIFLEFQYFPCIHTQKFMKCGYKIEIEMKNTWGNAAG